jgi:predicted Fe-S protein YdhL (DUF1289 family)
VCQLNAERGICIGCLRTLDEIARWSGMNDAERGAVLAALPARRQARKFPTCRCAADMRILGRRAGVRLSYYDMHVGLAPESIGLPARQFLSGCIFTNQRSKRWPIT